MPPQIPTGANAQYYANGRGLARYQAQKPLATDPTAGTPIWWSNEGVKDVWAGVPSRIGQETIWLDTGGSPRLVVGGPGAGTSPGTSPPQAGSGPAPTYQRRGAPAYQPRPGQTGPGIYIPPPPLRAAGFSLDNPRAGGGSWSRPKRARSHSHPVETKQRWVWP